MLTQATEDFEIKGKATKNIANDPSPINDTSLYFTGTKDDGHAPLCRTCPRHYGARRGLPACCQTHPSIAAHRA